MNLMKLVYYFFGGFIGFMCGGLIGLIFYGLQKSGSEFANYLVQNFGFFGKYVLELINALPLIGLALGLLLVKVLFGAQFDDQDPPTTVEKKK